jgi:hypothetical protein
MVRKTIEQGNTGNNKSIYPSILANEKVPASDKKFARLADDALFLMVAGTDAPTQALAITLFHILNNSEAHQRVRAELHSALPDMIDPPQLEKLEQLPYLVRRSNSIVPRPWSGLTNNIIPERCLERRTPNIFNSDHSTSSHSTR